MPSYEEAKRAYMDSRIKDYPKPESVDEQGYFDLTQWNNIDEITIHDKDGKKVDLQK